jgi:hypothetical protein
VQPAEHGLAAVACTNETADPIACSKAAWLKLSKKKPRASSKIRGSITSTPGIGVGVTLIGLPP